MYFEGLDIIRLLGFVWVFLHHIQVPILLIRENGWIGMDLLFTLSGFLITSRPKDNFYIKRILRIWPLYFLYLFLIGHYDQTWPYMLFAGNWQIMLHGWSSFVLVGHLWAISMQEQFYLVFPLLFKHLNWVICCGLILSTGLKFIFFNPDNYFYIYMNTFTRLEPFLLGSLVALYNEKIKKHTAKVWLIFVLGLISFNFINIRESLNIWIVVLGYLWVAIWCASFIQLILHNSYFKIQIVKKLAGLGFGLYVWHKLAMVITGNNVVLAFVLTVTIAYISYEGYEKWFYKLKSYFRH